MGFLHVFRPYVLAQSVKLTKLIIMYIVLSLFHVSGYLQAGEKFRKISVAYLFDVMSSYHMLHL